MCFFKNAARHRTMEEYYAQKGFLGKNKKGLSGNSEDLEIRYKLNLSALAQGTTLPYDRKDDIKYAKKKGHIKLAKALTKQK